MRVRAQGFLLLAIAFSSALTFSLETSVQTKNVRAASKSTSGNLTETQPHGSKFKGLTSFLADHGLKKRSAEVLPQPLSGEEDNKEPPLGPRQSVPFAENRAKKEYSGDDYCARVWKARVEGALSKRFLLSLGEMVGGKRANLAFHGMRGKKSGDDEGGEYVDAGRWAEGSGEGAGEGEGLGKRSPYAFQGMRGKKEYEYELKRAMGFLGMRGKKGTDVGEYKRAPQTSFFGMKGKKAQSSGFFGMRGKKGSPNAFFGIKGKRQPSGYGFQDFSLLDQFKESGASNNRFRRGITWLNNSKKAKNAFFGIRGKKSTPKKGSGKPDLTPL